MEKIQATKDSHDREMASSPSKSAHRKLKERTGLSMKTESKKKDSHKSVTAATGRLDD